MRVLYAGFVRITSGHMCFFKLYYVCGEISNGILRKDFKNLAIYPYALYCFESNQGGMRAGQSRQSVCVYKAE